jgi:hypothetical protein
MAKILDGILLIRALLFGINSYDYIRPLIGLVYTDFFYYSLKISVNQSNQSNQWSMVSYNEIAKNQTI